MTWFRRSRFVTSLIAILSMAFMQLAIAGYACPALEVAEGSGAAALIVLDESSAMTNCHDADPELPNLCTADAQAGSQSLDKPQLPPVQGFVAAALSTTVVFSPSDEAVHKTATLRSVALERSTTPPLAIQHCCFRI